MSLENSMKWNQVLTGRNKGFMVAWLGLWVCAGPIPGMAAQKEDTVVKPSWTTAGTHPSYPPPRYLQGVGLSKATKNPVRDRLTADQNAFAEVIRQISAEVSSDLSVEKMEVQGDTAETVLERSSSGTTIRSALTVNGLTIVDRFYDPQDKINYSLAVLDRTTAAEPYRQALDRHASDYQAYMRSAEQYRQEGKVLPYLLTLREVYHAASQYQEALPSFRLLAGQTEFELEEIGHPGDLSPTAILESFSTALSKVQLRPETGDRQLYVFGKPLADPLLVRLVLEGDTPTPIEDVPITFRFRSGQGEIFPPSAKTDGQGRVSVSVARVDKSLDDEYAISASVDMEELLDTGQYGGLWNSRIPIDPMSVLFTLKRKVPASATGISVLVSDRSDYPGNPLILRNVLISSLSQVGFRSINSSDDGNGDFGRFRRPDGELSWEMLRKRIPKNVQIVIVGEILSSSVSRTMGMVVCNVNGSVKAVEVKSGRTLSTQPFQEIRGFGSSEGQAKDTAYKNAGLAVVESLAGDLLTLEGGP